MTVVESMVKLGLEKDKFESSKSEEWVYMKGITRKIMAMATTMVKFVLSENDKSKGKAVRLGSSAKSAEAKEPENEKKLVECFLCHGLHRGVESKRSKRTKKKRVKYFLCRCPYELWNCLKQFKLVVVKEKTTSKLVESSKRLSPKEEMILTST
ncbi:hypothetical protein Godav_027171 [Gossypium davidsonii]|uniref:Uncharacterized protein n=1 Tax=Gossypium davidsonii TaxID=34287 RepID=A0A7J8RVC7_GOSDV|nr:hypothetical protein [Gossypium davidsonii]